MTRCLPVDCTGLDERQNGDTKMTEATSPWLTDGEQRAWRHYLRATRGLEAVLDRDLVAHGMSLAEYELLSMLSESPRRRMRMSVLADLVVQSRSRVTHTATRLERRGWVERQRCMSDSRGVELVLTAQGHEAVGEAAELHARGVRRYLVDAMTDEQFAALGDAMRKVEQRIDDDRSGA